MKRMCCSNFHIGNRFLEYKAPYENQSETHGYCEICLPKEVDKADKEWNFKKELKKLEGKEKP